MSYTRFSSLHSGDGWWKPLCPRCLPPSYHQKLSTKLKYTHRRGHLPSFSIWVIYNRWWTHSWHVFLITERSRHTESTTPLCFWWPQRSVGWVRESWWRSQKQTHDFLSFCIGLTHTQMESSYSQPRSGSKERVLGLLGGKEGKLTYVWETIGLVEKWRDDGDLMGYGRQQSPYANLTGIYDITMHRILCHTIKVPSCYVLRKHKLGKVV